jgi:acrylyl-CoA reductase (NADPH)
MAPLARRQQAWDRLARDLDLNTLEAMIEEVPLERAIEKAQALMDGQVSGRVVVRI